MTRAVEAQPCPCGRKEGRSGLLPYVRCCGMFIGQGQTAPDAETLMRSRYSAFALGESTYLLNTWHASTRPHSLDLESDVKWLGLEVRSRQDIDADHAEVEFVARSRHGGRGHRLHERSRFVKEEGRWFYVDGDLY